MLNNNYRSGYRMIARDAALPIMRLISIFYLRFGDQRKRAWLMALEQYYEVTGHYREFAEWLADGPPISEFWRVRRATEKNAVLAMKTYERCTRLRIPPLLISIWQA